MGLEGKNRFALLFGIFLGAGLLLMYLAMIVQCLVHPCQQIGVRVLGILDYHEFIVGSSSLTGAIIRVKKFLISPVIDESHACFF